MKDDVSLLDIEACYLRPDEFDAHRGAHGVDVLHITSSINWSWPLPLWFLEKTSRWTRRMTQAGHRCKAVVPQRLLPNCSYEELVDIIHYLAPRMVISRSFALRARDVEALALSLPDSILVQSNHSPNSFMLNNASGSPAEWLESLKLAQRQDNVFLSSVSEADSTALSCLAPDGKVTWIPNPCELGALRPSSRSLDPDCVNIGMAGRCNFQKNLKSQIDAVACLAKTRKVRFYLFLGHDPADGTREIFRNYTMQMLEPLGVQVSVLDFVEPSVLMNFANRELDIFLQVTFDESFGYLNWEMMSQGVATITTPHIDVVGTVSAEPTQIHDIVSAMERIIADSDALKSRSLDLAREAGDRNNATFDSAIDRLLSHAPMQTSQ